jgi:hypothetical protein
MSRTNVYHVALEPIEARYSAQWLKCINREFKRYAGNRAIMIDILGDEDASKPTAGGFLDFCKTNKWKSSQIIKLARLFENGYITAGDTIFFSDAWNPGILNVRYMSDLLDIPVKIVSYWHAGSYDTNDVLGYKIKNRQWSIAAEQSFFHASDVNVFATEFHKDFFVRNCLLNPYQELADNLIYDAEDKCLVSGQPHYEILKSFEGKANPSWQDKKDWIIFPHRDAPEKQPWLFEQLSDLLPQYEFIFTHGLNLSKDAYYDLLRQSKIVVSMSKHEMLGISMMEGVLAGCIPVVPNRLSYMEMYRTPYLYPDTDDVTVIKNHIQMVMDNPNIFIKELHGQAETLKHDFLTCDPLWEALLGDK